MVVVGWGEGWSGAAMGNSENQTIEYSLLKMSEVETTKREKKTKTKRKVLSKSASCVLSYQTLNNHYRIYTVGGW